MPPDPVRRPFALRRRLTLVMLGPLFIVALLIGIAGLTVIADVVRRSNDRVLSGALGAIAETVQVDGDGVTFDLPAAAFGMLENAERDSVFYRLALGDRTLTGYAGLPTLAEDAARLEEPRFHYARFHGLDIRVAELRRTLPGVAAPVVVQVAETLDYRRAVRRRLSLAFIGGELALLGVAMMLLRPALVWSLRPLDRLRDAIADRDTRASPDLSPLGVGPLPTELNPLTAAFDRLLARLDAATTGVRRFTADASHQMRTPLATLRLQVALARRGDASALDEIDAAAGRLEHLVIQLLALARADEAGASPPLERVDLREVAIAVINRHITRAIAAQVELTLQARETGTIVLAHRTLLFEIVSNLVDNAIRYNRPGGLVVVTVAEEHARTLLSVADDGPGIAAADMDRLGERFVRLDRSGETEGSGLGFAIVRAAARRIDATLRIENTAPGLRVTVELAAADRRVVPD